VNGLRYRFAVECFLIGGLLVLNSFAQVEPKSSVPAERMGQSINASEANSPSAAQPLEFKNIAAQAGLTRAFPNGGANSKSYIVETTGSGIAFLTTFFITSSSFPAQKEAIDSITTTKKDISSMLPKQWG
jgi:hypothetical protein